MNIKQFISEHPYATGVIVIVGGIFLLIIMRSRGSSSGGSVDAVSLEMAKLNAATSLQSMQLQAQQNIAGAQVGVANNQLAAELAKAKLESVTAITTQRDVLTSHKDELGIQADLYKTAIVESTKQNAVNVDLSKYVIQHQYDLAKAGIEFGKRDNRGVIGANIVALALGQGNSSNIDTLNQGNSAQQIATAFSHASIVGSLSNIASGFLGGMFG